MERDGQAVAGSRCASLRGLLYNSLSPMDTRNFTYMFYGFLAAWLILIVYVVSLAARERRLQKALEDVKRLVEEREKK